MRELRVHKVTVNIGVGESGDKLAKAETLLQRITGVKPVRTLAKVTEPTFSIRKKQQIGVKVTLRKANAEDFIKKALVAAGKKVRLTSFDKQGGFSFGVKECLEFPGFKYDPQVGVFGFDVCVDLERPGYRVKRRSLKRSAVGHAHLITKEDAMEFAKNKLGVEISGEA